MVKYDKLDKIIKDAIIDLQAIQKSDKSSIVFDIDDTLIDNDGKLISPVYDLFVYAKYIGLNIFIITNRLGSVDVIKYTNTQLDNYGINCNTKFFRSPYGDENPWKYKYLARKTISDRNYDIIMSVGDMPWDIGDYGGVGIIIPT